MASINKFVPSRSKLAIAVWILFMIVGPYGLYKNAVSNEWSWIVFVVYSIAIYGMFRFYVLANKEYVKLDSHANGCVEVKLMRLFRAKINIREGLSNAARIEIFEESEGPNIKFLKFSDGYKLRLPRDYDNKLEESILKWFRENYNKELQVELHGFRRVNWKAISWKKINWKKIIKKER